MPRNQQAFYNLEPPPPLSAADDALATVQNSAITPALLDIPGSFTPALRLGFHHSMQDWFTMGELIGTPDEVVDTEERFREIVKSRNIKFVPGRRRGQWEQEKYIHDEQALLEGLNELDDSIFRDVAEFTGSFVGSLLHPTVMASIALTAGAGAFLPGFAGLTTAGRYSFVSKMQTGHTKSLLRGMELGTAENALFLPADAYLTERTGQREFGIPEVAFSLGLGAFVGGLTNVAVQFRNNNIMKGLNAEDLDYVLRFYEAGGNGRADELLEARDLAFQLADGELKSKLDLSETGDEPRVTPEATESQRNLRESERLFDEQGILKPVKRTSSDFRIRELEQTRYRGVAMNFDNDFERALFMIGRGDESLVAPIIRMLVETGGVPADTEAMREVVKAAAKKFAARAEKYAEATNIFPESISIFDILSSPVHDVDVRPEILNAAVTRNGVTITFENDLVKALYLFNEAEPSGALVHKKALRKYIRAASELGATEKQMSQLSDALRESISADISQGIPTKVRIDNVGQRDMGLQNDLSVDVKGLRGDMDLQEGLLSRFDVQPPMAPATSKTAPSPEVIGPMNEVVPGGKNASMSEVTETELVEQFKEQLRANKVLDEDDIADIENADKVLVKWFDEIEACHA